MQVEYDPLNVEVPSVQCPFPPPKVWSVQASMKAHRMLTGIANGFGMIAGAASAHQIVLRLANIFFVVCAQLFERDRIVADQAQLLLGKLHSAKLLW